MSLTLLIGFSAIAGLLVGYLSARMGPRWVFTTLLGLCVIVGLAVVVWGNLAAEVDPFLLVVLLVGIVAPFAGCTLIAGLIGLVARRIANRTEPQ